MCARCGCGLTDGPLWQVGVSFISWIRSGLLSGLNMCSNVCRHMHANPVSGWMPCGGWVWVKLTSGVGGGAGTRVLERTDGFACVKITMWQER